MLACVHPATRLEQASTADPRPAPALAETRPDGRLPGEFEPVDRVLIAWTQDNIQYAEFFGPILVQAAQRSRLSLVVAEGIDERLFQYELRQLGVSLDQVEVQRAPLDTMWIRDYGPLVVHKRDGRAVVVDPHYDDERTGDDRVPQVLANVWRLPVDAIPMEIHGGHIQSDGAGRCIVTDDLHVRNAELDMRSIADLLFRHYGCEVTAMLPALLGEETGHVDIFAYITSPGRLLLGQYTPAQDHDNAIRLDHAAEILEGVGFEVTRIPMPTNSRRRIFRTYTNALAIDGAVLVPVYRRARRHEAKAIEAFEAAFPDRDIVPIRADRLIELAGAVHCTTITTSRGGLVTELSPFPIGDGSVPL
jgi:agmatine/peptidylarginine deiminase